MTTTLSHPTTGLVIFSHKELASPDNGAVVLATGFAEYLIKLRVEFGLPMIVNSCCRTEAHNASLKGAHPRSLHLMHNPFHEIDGTAAIDIHVESGMLRGRLVATAWERGWSIGIGKTFTHLDTRFLADLPQKMFVY